MKKTITTIALIVIMTILTILQAQEVVSRYRMLGAEYNVEATENARYYISVAGGTVLAKEPFMIMPKEMAASFRKELEVIKNKYPSWVKASEDNKMNNEIIPLDAYVTQAATYGWRFTEWAFTFTPEVPRFAFGVCNNQPYVALWIGEQTSSSNQFITWGAGTIMILTTVDEIQSLIDALDPAKVTQKYDAIRRSREVIK